MISFRDLSKSFDSLQPLWASKNLPKFFSKSKLIIVFCARIAKKINKEELSLLKHNESFLKGPKFHCDFLCCRYFGVWLCVPPRVLSVSIKPLCPNNLWIRPCPCFTFLVIIFDPKKICSGCHFTPVSLVHGG